MGCFFMDWTISNNKNYLEVDNMLVPIKAIDITLKDINIDEEQKSLEFIFQTDENISDAVLRTARKLKEFKNALCIQITDRINKLNNDDIHKIIKLHTNEKNKNQEGINKLKQELKRYEQENKQLLSGVIQSLKNSIKKNESKQFGNTEMVIEVNADDSTLRLQYLIDKSENYNISNKEELIVLYRDYDYSKLKIV